MSETDAFSPAVPARMVRELAPIGDRREHLTPQEQSAVAQGESQWLPKIIRTDSTPISELMASPAHQAIMAAPLGGVLGASTGAALGELFGGGYTGRGAALGGVLGGLGLAADRFIHQHHRNDHIEEIMRRLPPGSTLKDYDTAQLLADAFVNRFAMKGAAQKTLFKSAGIDENSFVGGFLQGCMESNLPLYAIKRAVDAAAVVLEDNIAQTLKNGFDKLAGGLEGMAEEGIEEGPRLASTVGKGLGAAANTAESGFNKVKGWLGGGAKAVEEGGQDAETAANTGAQTAAKTVAQTAANTGAQTAANTAGMRSIPRSAWGLIKAAPVQAGQSVTRGLMGGVTGYNVAPQNTTGRIGGAVTGATLGVANSIPGVAKLIKSTPVGNTLEKGLTGAEGGVMGGLAMESAGLAPAGTAKNLGRIGAGVGLGGGLLQNFAKNPGVITNAVGKATGGVDQFARGSMTAITGGGLPEQWDLGKAVLGRGQYKDLSFRDRMFGAATPVEPGAAELNAAKVPAPDPVTTAAAQAKPIPGGATAPVGETPPAGSTPPVTPVTDPAATAAQHAKFVPVNSALPNGPGSRVNPSGKVEYGGLNAPPADGPVTSPPPGPETAPVESGGINAPLNLGDQPAAAAKPIPPEANIMHRVGQVAGAGAGALGTAAVGLDTLRNIPGAVQNGPTNVLNASSGAVDGVKNWLGSIKDKITSGGLSTMSPDQMTDYVAKHPEMKPRIMQVMQQQFDSMPEDQQLTMIAGGLKAHGINVDPATLQKGLGMLGSLKNGSNEANSFLKPISDMIDRVLSPLVSKEWLASANPLEKIMMVVGGITAIGGLVGGSKSAGIGGGLLAAAGILIPMFMQGGALPFNQTGANAPGAAAGAATSLTQPVNAVGPQGPSAAKAYAGVQPPNVMAANDWLVAQIKKYGGTFKPDGSIGTDTATQAALRRVQTDPHYAVNNKLVSDYKTANPNQARYAPHPMQ